MSSQSSLSSISSVDGPIQGHKTPITSLATASELLDGSVKGPCLPHAVREGLQSTIESDAFVPLPIMSAQDSLPQMLQPPACRDHSLSISLRSIASYKNHTLHDCLITRLQRPLMRGLSDVSDVPLAPETETEGLSAKRQAALNLEDHVEVRTKQKPSHSSVSSCCTDVSVHSGMNRHGCHPKAHEASVTSSTASTEPDHLLPTAASQSFRHLISQANPSPTSSPLSTQFLSLSPEQSHAKLIDETSGREVGVARTSNTTARPVSVFQSFGNDSMNAARRSTMRHNAKVPLNDIEAALLDLVRVSSVPTESLAAAMVHVVAVQSKAPDVASIDDGEAALALLSRIGASATPQERSRLVNAIARPPKCSVHDHEPLSSVFAYGSLGYRAMNAAAVRVSKEAGGASDVAGLAYSAIHNPLFALLTPASAKPTGDVWTHMPPVKLAEACPDKASSALLLSRVAQLEGAKQVVDTAMWKAKSSDPSVPGVVLSMQVTHWLRKRIIALTLTQMFEMVMLLAVLSSCVVMVLEHPRIPKKSLKMRSLEGCDLALTIVFMVELVSKVITFGFRDYWEKASNRMDAIIVLMSILLLVVESSGLSFFKSFRTLRALKAIRVATRSSSMQQIINSMISSMSSMFNVTLLLFIVFVMFAILGVQLFSGLFWRCTDPTVSHQNECIGTFYPPGVTHPVPREWLNALYTFDSLPSALLTLFVVSTLEGYSSIMTSAMGAPPGKGMQPQKDANPYNAYFFVAFIIVAVFVMLNLYVGMSLPYVLHQTEVMMG
jgi:hypothetical protein